jgi:hypothetical protein
MPIRNPDNLRLTRRQWLGIVPAGIAVSATHSLLFAEDEKPQGVATDARPDDVFPALSRELVSAVVGASHTNIEKVRSLVTKRPALARASWDWGFGDWETALGAASHMGRADIATLLMEHGARPNLFTMAMLGNLDAVKAFVEAMPGIQRTLGPHGITLLNHVRAAQWHSTNSDEHKDKAREVEKYLESLGDADTGQMSLELSDDDKQSYAGTYRFGRGPAESIEIGLHRRGMLTLKVGPDGDARNLRRVGVHDFSPSAVDEVHIRFSMDGKAANRLTIHDPEPVLVANRVSTVRAAGSEND